MVSAYQLTSKLKEAIQIAQSQAHHHAQPKFSGGHLLWAVLHEDIGLHPFLSQLGKNVQRMQSWAMFRIEHYPKTSRIVEQPPADEKALAALKEANKIRKKEFEEEISPLHLLQAICQPHVAFSDVQLKRFPLTPAEITKTVGATQTIEQAVNPQQAATQQVQAADAIHRFCEDLTAKARQDKIDPVIGRDKELKQMMEILGKRLSPNILIVGEPGVGKTAIVGGLALEIVGERVADTLKNAAIFELDVNGSLVAGAYKGEVEERLKKVLMAVKAYGKAILFIDEIHILLDPQSSVGSGAVNLLKPELARGEILLIGATTQMEFRKHIESDEAFMRRFTKLTIDEPDMTTAGEMLEGIVPRFEDTHKLQLNRAAIPELVQLAKRYLTTTNLPASAIGLIDFTMSAVRHSNDTSQATVKRLQEELQQLIERKDLPKETLERFHNKINHSLSHILLSQLTENQEATGMEDVSEVTTYLQESLTTLGTFAEASKEEVVLKDIAATVAYQTGIPLGKIDTQELVKLMNMEAMLRKRVVGQDYALKVVADAVRRARAGIQESNKPMGVFFFVGPTGTGKTELAKTLAELLFNDESALLRFDMSEYKESHSVALLYGSPPGYVGYKEGGLLVNKIRQKPYSVVLFDEIEKAHSSVYDIFLSIVDEGIVTDKLDKKGDFSKSIIIFTSNIGSDWITNYYNQGKVPQKEDMRSLLQNASDAHGKKYFRPEFLGRRMSLIPFAPITEEIAPLILDIHVRNFKKILEQQNITLELSDRLRMALVRLGFSPQYGARPLKDTIEYRLGTPIADKIIAGNIEKNSIVLLDIDDSDELVWKVSPSKT